MWWLSIPSNRNRLIRSLALSLVIVGVSFFFLLIVIYYGMRIARIILPGVYVGNQNLSFKTISSAAPLIDTQWNQRHQIVLFGEGWQTARKPVQLGLYMEAEATAERAYEFGYQDGFVAGVWRMLGLDSQELLIVPVITLDESTAQAGLQDAALEAAIVPQEARITFEGDQISALPGVFGRTLDVEATYQALAANPLLTFLSGYLPATLSPVVPAVSKIPPDVLIQAQSFIAQNLVFRAYDPVVDQFYQWDISPETLAAAMRLQIQGGQIVLATDSFPLQAELSQYSNSFAPDRWLDQENLDEMLTAVLQPESQVVFTVRHAPTVYTVQPGDTLLVIAWNQGIPLWRIIQANPGLDPDHLIAGTDLVIPSRDELIDLPVVMGKRILVDLTDQHLYGFEGDNLVISEIISTGIDRSPTQPGIFQVRSHVPNAYASVWDLYMPDFIGIYEAWPGFENGFHGLPVLSSGQTLWGGVLGRPVSYGCIILNSNAAKNLYSWAEEGVIVEIRE
jgi:LysM repeat protein